MALAIPRKEGENESLKCSKPNSGAQKSAHGSKKYQEKRSNAKVQDLLVLHFVQNFTYEEDGQTKEK